MPLGLRRPLANRRFWPVCRSTSQIAARPASISMPFSPTLLLEPTVAYSLLPSWLAMMFLVQWWFSGLPGKSVTCTPAALICVCPASYGNLMMASALATYRLPPTSAMPNGEFKPCKKTDRVSATPSPLASRSSVMRLALGTPAPAFFITTPMTQRLMLKGRSSGGGLLLSATSTSPLGSTCTQRGWSRSRASAVTAKPAMGLGVSPSGQAFAGAILTVGIRPLLGCGRVGVAPMPAAGGSDAMSPQAASVPRTTRNMAPVRTWRA